MTLHLVTEKDPTWIPVDSSQFSQLKRLFHQDPRLSGLPNPVCEPNPLGGVKLTWENEQYEVTASIDLKHFCVEMLAYCRLPVTERQQRSLPLTTNDSFVLSPATCLDFAQFVQKFVPNG